MNYYEHHLGDYAQATSHLTFVEDAAYSRMLRKYYAEEKPLPADLRAVIRLVGARTDEEREAVETVLNEFFVLEEDGWHNKRADDEIQKVLAKREKAQKSARSRWNANASGNDANASNVHANASKLDANGMLELRRSHAKRNALQSPDTKHQTPEDQKKARASLARPPEVPAQTWDDWLALRKAKKAPVTETVLKQAKAEATKAGMPLARFLEIWCARGSQGLQADWLKPHERAGPSGNGQRPSAAADFRGKTYTGTDPDDLPASLRPAA